MKVVALAVLVAFAYSSRQISNKYVVEDIKEGDKNIGAKLKVDYEAKDNNGHEYVEFHSINQFIQNDGENKEENIKKAKEDMEKRGEEIHKKLDKNPEQVLGSFHPKALTYKE